MIDRERLHRDGYALVRGAIPAEWLDDLRAAFDTGVKPSERWPVPRGPGWRHSLLDLDPKVQAVCRLPEILATVGELIAERFFLSQVEGREPLAGGGHQKLHRDLSARRPGDMVSALAYFDDYGPENGATRIVPGSHRSAPGEPPFDFNDESRSVQLSGSAGDILVFDADLVHAASLNPTGARRRSILIGYSAEPLYASHLETVKLRSVQMDTTDRFDPSGLAWAGGADNAPALNAGKILDEGKSEVSSY
ncbi:MAG TPA: phytanoyl-CoA dioxygenase family protein [Gemmataceae bacterium]|nr:phytanoyl-CoA dioxygenase family protein [Gemmataceae bacterium]